MNDEIKVGDIVCHKASFLRSVGWYTNVPKDGRVVAVSTLGHGITVLTIEWCHGDRGKILSSNVILASRKHLEPA